MPSIFAQERFEPYQGYMDVPLSVIISFRISFRRKTTLPKKPS
jgi:hypothetical protein